MNENDEQNLFKYGLIFLIVIFTIVAIVSITMIDFSKNKTEQNMSKLELARQEYAKNKQNIKIDTSEIIDENIVDTNEEILNDESNDIFNKLTGNKLTVTKDRITGYLDEEYYDSITYLEFDENDVLKGLFVEIHCVNEEVVDSFYQVYSGTMFFNNVNRSGLNLYIEYPLNENAKFLTRQQIESSLSKEYYLEYQY